MIIPIVIGALGTVTKGLLKGLEDLEITRQVETFQTTARGVVVIVVGNEHGDSSSNSGRD